MTGTAKKNEAEQNALHRNTCVQKGHAILRRLRTKNHRSEMPQHNSSGNTRPFSFNLKPTRPCLVQRLAQLLPRLIEVLLQRMRLQHQVIPLVLRSESGRAGGRSKRRERANRRIGQKIRFSIATHRSSPSATPTSTASSDRRARAADATRLALEGAWPADINQRVEGRATETGTVSLSDGSSYRTTSQLTHTPPARPNEGTDFKNNQHARATPAPSLQCLLISLIFPHLSAPEKKQTHRHTRHTHTKNTPRTCMIASSPGIDAASTGRGLTALSDRISSSSSTVSSSPVAGHCSQSPSAPHWLREGGRKCGGGWGLGGGGGRDQAQNLAWPRACACTPR